MPDWSSVSSKEYTVVNGKVLKLLIRDSRSNVFKFLMNLHHNSFLFAGKSTKMQGESWSLTIGHDMTLS